MRTIGVTVRALIGLSLGVAIVLASPVVSAKGKKSDSSAKKSEKKKVLVGGFDGPKADQARKAVIAALKDDGEYDVGEASSVKPGADDGAFAKAASGGASAVLVGTVKKGSGLTVSVHNGADGALIQDVDIKGDSSAKLSKSIDATLSVSVADAIGQGKPGSGGGADSDEKPAAADAAKKNDDDDEKKAPSDEKKAEDEKPAESNESTSNDDFQGASPLDVQLGVRAVHRSFDYHDTPAQLFPDKGFPAPLTYKLPLGPAVFLDATIYPMAFVGGGPAANIGITGGYEVNFATKSVYDEGKPDEVQLTTRASQYYIGLRGRLPVAKHEFGLVAAYGQQVFNLLGDEQNPLVPDVSYRFVKLGVDSKLRFDDLILGFHLGTRIVTDTGGLKSTWFPNAKAQSIEGGLLAGYGIVDHLDLLVGVDLVRYAFNFNPIPDNANPNNQAIAGGGVDQYVSGYLALRYQLPGHY